jgi:hypothetical protein
MHASDAQLEDIAEAGRKERAANDDDDEDDDEEDSKVKNGIGSRRLLIGSLARKRCLALQR